MSTTPDHDDTDTSLWEMLGIPRDDESAAVTDDAWAQMLAVAFDPDTPAADPDLVPVMTDGLDIPDDTDGGLYDAYAGDLDGGDAHPDLDHLADLHDPHSTNHTDLGHDHHDDDGF